MYSRRDIIGTHLESLSQTESEHAARHWLGVYIQHQGQRPVSDTFKGVWLDCGVLIFLCNDTIFFLQFDIAEYMKLNDT